MSKAINSQPLETLTQQLDQGATTSVELVEDALARSKDPSGQGPRVYTQLFETQALNAARASDLLRAAGLKRSMIEGIVVAVKDFFDVAGHVTRAGSVILADQPPALHDADVVARLRAAGAIVLGTTNMTEFAYSGLGINPHYGTPLGPFDRSAGRIPGGSSSGAGVAVSDGMASVSIATDTGGSIRIPAAFCGLTGFKRTAHRISQKGLMPLSRAAL